MWATQKLSHGAMLPNLLRTRVSDLIKFQTKGNCREVIPERIWVVDLVLWTNLDFPHQQNVTTQI